VLTVEQSEVQVSYSVSIPADADGGEQTADSISSVLAQVPAEDFTASFVAELEQTDPGVAASVGVTSVASSATAPAVTVSAASAIPTPSPTPSPPTPSPTSGSGPISAKGDPHLVNMYGERFDLMRPGVHSLVHIPKYSQAFRTLLDIKADVRRLGEACTDMYVQAINVTGAWARQPGHQAGFFFSASGPRQDAGWQSFGAVSMKVVHARTERGVPYLNFLLRHLSNVKNRIGGLLGEDDHTDVATTDPACLKKNLVAL